MAEKMKAAAAAPSPMLKAARRLGDLVSHYDTLQAPIAKILQKEGGDASEQAFWEAVRGKAPKKPAKETAPSTTKQKESKP